MRQVLVTFTRAIPMRRPKPLPTITEQEAHQWFNGWWHGIAVGIVTGAGIGVIFTQGFA